MQESELLKRLRQRKQRALELVMDQYGAYVTQVVRNVLGSAGTPEDVEELSVDVFYALWEHADTVGDGKLKAWLGAVARNRSRDRLRRWRPMLPMDQDVLSLPGDSLEEETLGRLQREVLLARVRAMEEPEREIFLRYYYLYHTMEEISRQMNIPLGTVKSSLHRGRKRLQEYFSEQEA